jgi:acid phosphatase class B
MLFKRQVILSLFILSFSLSLILNNASYSTSVSAQTSRLDEQKEQKNAKRAADIQDEISSNKQVATLCSNVRNIDFKLTGDKLLIITGNHFCSYTIVKEILQPQLSVGKIKTYAFTGDQEDVLVNF